MGKSSSWLSVSREDAQLPQNTLCTAVPSSLPVIYVSICLGHVRIAACKHFATTPEGRVGESLAACDVRRPGDARAALLHRPALWRHVPALRATLVRRRQGRRRRASPADADRASWHHAVSSRHNYPLDLAVSRVFPAGVRRADFARRGLHSAGGTAVRRIRRHGALQV